MSITFPLWSLFFNACSPKEEPKKPFSVEEQATFDSFEANPTDQQLRKLVEGIVGEAPPWNLDDDNPETSFDAIIRQTIDTRLSLG